MWLVNFILSLFRFSHLIFQHTREEDLPLDDYYEEDADSEDKQDPPMGYRAP
jgi:hypothetical protein